MEIKRAGSRPITVAPAEYFSGVVHVEPVIALQAPSRLSSLVVSFEPAARTAWHTHPLGQTLLILTGLGLAQKHGEAVQELQPGDVVYFAPGEKHWHGASPTSAMSHLVMQEALDGSAVTWLEHVTDAEYNS